MAIKFTDAAKLRAEPKISIFVFENRNYCIAGETIFFSVCGKCFPIILTKSILGAKPKMPFIIL